MRGLRKQESRLFENWFAEIQRLAKAQNCVFFLDTGEGHALQTDTVDIEDLSGWLVPDADSDLFESIWKDNPSDDKLFSAPWGENYTFVEWHQDMNGKIVTEFKQYT